MIKQSILTGRCAAALLANMAEHGFTASLSYRSLPHALNNKNVEAAHCDMLATIAVHKQGGMTADAAALGLRVRAIGRVRSKDAMNWQIDDLINFLQSWVEAGQLTEEREAEEQAKASPALTKVTFCRGGSGEVYRLTPGKGFADMLVGGDQVWRESVTTADYMLGELAAGRAVEVKDPKAKAAPAKPEPAPVSVCAANLCRLIEQRGLGDGLPLVGMLETVQLLNPAARRIKGQLLDILTATREVDSADLRALREIIERHCGGWVSRDRFELNWGQAYRKLSAIALSGKVREITK